ncbi:elongation factor G, mitochondrial-like [Trifolium pratense]|uniref:elongation factor G, mitochondrial-like n=1 Tax=Trifolium pratense TaxID=57577 RepID=UPI001E692CF1|nr:elongation factor G, mitochondrial-like [Trifolium pratense]
MLRLRVLCVPLMVPFMFFVNAVGKTPSMSELNEIHSGQGLQLLLDRVLDYFPCPIEASNYSLDQSKNGEKHSLVALAFTLKDRICQITFLRVFEGVVRKGDFITNANTGKTFEVPYVIGVLNNMPERFPEVQEANAGEIVTLALPMNRQGRPFEGSKGFMMMNVEELDLKNVR